jgi:hypothetical protein
LLLKQFGNGYDLPFFVFERNRTNVNGYTTAIFMQGEQRRLNLFAVSLGAGKQASRAGADRRSLRASMNQDVRMTRPPNHLLAQIARDLFRRLVPERNPPIQSYDVHTYRKRVCNLAENVRTQRRHG